MMDLQQRRAELAADLERLNQLRVEIAEKALRIEGALLLIEELSKQTIEVSADAPPAQEEQPQ